MDIIAKFQKEKLKKDQKEIEVENAKKYRESNKEKEHMSEIKVHFARIIQAIQTSPLRFFSENPNYHDSNSLFYKCKKGRFICPVGAGRGEKEKGLLKKMLKESFGDQVEIEEMKLIPGESEFSYDYGSYVSYPPYLIFKLKLNT